LEINTTNFKLPLRQSKNQAETYDFVSFLVGIAQHQTATSLSDGHRAHNAGVQNKPFQQAKDRYAGRQATIDQE
jgi:hypothetical protein